MLRLKKYSFCLFTLLLFSWSSGLHAQNATVSRFTASSAAEKVLLDWVIAAGATCDGIGIYRGNDTVGMTLIHHIPGVCGDLARPVTYSFLDSFPFANQISYYRLELGPRVFTAPIAISLVDLGGQAYQFRPHPVADQANLYLPGETHRSYQLYIYDSRAQLRQMLRFSGTDFSFYTRDFEDGLYFFILHSQDGNIAQRGKLLIQR